MVRLVKTLNLFDTSNNFKYGFNSVFKVLFNFVSGYFQTRIQELREDTVNELNQKITELRNGLRVDAAGNMITEKAKGVLENLERVLSDSSKIETLNVKMEVYELVNTLNELIAQVRTRVIHSSTLSFLLENSFRNDLLYESLGK